jgi:signal transduction histidine kinase
MPVFSLTSRRRATLATLAERVLEAPDHAGLARLLTADLREALSAERATLLLWDRRLESFESLSLDEAGRLRRTRPREESAAGPRTRFLLSEGQLVETSPDAANEMLVPLLARSGLAGMLVLGPVPRRRRPVTDGEARLVSTIAARAALAFENLAYQKELIESERLAALGTMAGMMVHDFRGPMTLIRGWAETLVEGDIEPAEVATRAKAIVDAVDRLERMTGETLDFARGAERLVMRQVPLGILVAELAAGIELDLPGLTVERDVELPGGRRGPVDVDKLRRAVSNIAANARDAMGGAGRILLRARVETLAGADGPREHLVLVLADDGPGVAPAIRERVFEPFVTHGKKRGTGLGLAVARRFVEDHGGRLELVASDPAQERGARFRIELPLPLDREGEPARSR